MGEMRGRLVPASVAMVLPLLMVTAATAQKPTNSRADVVSAEDAKTVDEDHALFNALLQEYVIQTPGSGPPRVDYRGLATQRADLQAYLATLGELDPEDYRSWKPLRQLAMLINAYNAFTLELILDNYPVASILDIPGAWTEPRWLLVGDMVSLDTIEHELIRKRFKDPRIHAVLVCAANSCPPLNDEAYTEKRLDGQLKYQSRLFCRDTTINRLQRSDETLYVSKVFEWFPEDFVYRWGNTQLPAGSPDDPAHRAIVGYFADHMAPPDRSYLYKVPVKIDYLEYDWGLNEVR